MKRRGLEILGCLALLSVACGGGGGAPAAVSGSIGFRLQLPDGVDVDSVDYTIMGPAAFDKNGSLSLESDLTFAGKIDGIPVGDGYMIALVSHAIDGDTQCQGSATFSVRARLVTAVGIRLECASDASGTATVTTLAGGAGGSVAQNSARSNGGSSAAATTHNSATSNGGSSAIAGSSAGGSSAGGSSGSSAMSNGGNAAVAIQGDSGGAAAADCPLIDCVSAVPAADGKSVSLHAVTLGTTATDQHTFEWTTSAGTLSDTASSDAVLQCPTSAGDIDLTFHVRAGSCSAQLDMQVTCSAGN